MHHSVSRVCESVACGNLGVIGSLKGDITTAKACMERHLQLTSTLNDARGQGDALRQLGALASEEGNYQEAGRCYEQALQIAKDRGEQDFENLAKCNLGVAQVSY